MAFNDKVRDLGNHVQFAVNTKGTGRRGTVIPGLSETQTGAPTENPTKLTTVGNRVRALRDLGSKRKISTKI
jgi:hypothetical protein